MRKGLACLLACCLMAVVWPAGAARAQGRNGFRHASSCGMACCKRGTPAVSCAAGLRCGGGPAADLQPSPLPPSVLPRAARLPIPGYAAPFEPVLALFNPAAAGEAPDRPPRI